MPFVREVEEVAVVADAAAEIPEWGLPGIEVGRDRDRAVDRLDRLVVPVERIPAGRRPDRAEHVRLGIALRVRLGQLDRLPLADPDLVPLDEDRR